MTQIKQDYKRKFLILVVLPKKTDFKTKITEIEGKIPIISSLAVNVALTAVENKIPNISSLVKKTQENNNNNKSIILQKSLKLKRNVLIIIMINILQLQILIL